MEIHHFMTQDALDALVWLSATNTAILLHDAERGIEAGDYLVLEAKERFMNVIDALGPYRSQSTTIDHELDRFRRRHDYVLRRYEHVDL